MVLYTVVCVLGVDRSVSFGNVHVNGSTLASLQGYLHMTTTSTSVIQCALQCLNSNECLSFLRDGMSGSCSMFRIGVGLNSGEAASPDTVYNKIGKKKQFNSIKEYIYQNKQIYTRAV